MDLRLNSCTAQNTTASRVYCYAWLYNFSIHWPFLLVYSIGLACFRQTICPCKALLHISLAERSMSLVCWTTHLHPTALAVPGTIAEILFASPGSGIRACRIAGRTSHRATLSNDNKEGSNGLCQNEGSRI
jgi:hypothetical protein